MMGEGWNIRKVMGWGLGGEWIISKVHDGGGVDH